MPVAESHKELRFTRARQAGGFAMAGAALLMTGLVFFLLSPFIPDNPQLPNPLWGLFPIALALGCFRVAWRCARHAYLLLTPLGVEIFPFFRPEKTMQLILWSEIADAEIDDACLTLHYTTARTAGVHLSLAPIALPQRELLAIAIEGRYPDSDADPGSVLDS